jgi:hypothetical protein
MTFRNEISQFLQSQFPANYREQAGVDITESNREVIIDFVEAYYEFVEENYETNFLLNRQMPSLRDIDTTLVSFISHFREKYLKNISYTSIADQRFVIKNIIDLYRSKGSEASIKLLMRLLYNVPVEVYVPGQDILRASDSIWIDPVYVETLTNPLNKGFVNKRIFGSISLASAYVESVSTKLVKGRYIDILYLSDIVGTFVFDDLISVDGNLNNAPKVTGSLTGITLDINAIGGFSLGDIVDIESASGIKGQAVIKSLNNRTGKISFQFLDGGFGYTLDENTNVYISNVIISASNDPNIFSIHDEVTQQLERVYIESGVSVVDSLTVGDNIVGTYNSVEVANGTVMSTGSTIINNIITEYVDIQVEDSSFLRNQILNLSASGSFIVGETVEEGSEITLGISGLSGSYANGETVLWQEFYAEANTVTETFARGVVVDANTTAILVENAFGDFTANTIISGVTSGANSTIDTINVTSQGATGTISETIDSDSIRVVLTNNELFTANTLVYHLSSRVTSTISNTEFEGTEIITSGVYEANTQPILATDISFTGVVIEQTDTRIGIAKTSDYPYIHIDNVSVITSQNNVSHIVDSIEAGTDASFEIGGLTNIEEVPFGNQLIAYINTRNVDLTTVLINGEGSGLGYVDSVIVNGGGSGYSDSDTVTFSGGGYANQEVLFTAEGTVSTSAGAITGITVTASGEDYFSAPSISVSGGSGANLEVSMVYGYGFINEIMANPNTVIAEALSTSNVEIGTISSLVNVNPGDDYLIQPFVHLHNRVISSYGKQDYIMLVTTTSGSFQEGEIITQADTNAKGSISSKTGNSFRIRNLSFNNDFELSGVSNGHITGANTGSTGIVTNITSDTSEEVMGFNASVNPYLIDTAGIVNDTVIYRSGYGYLPNEPITITTDNGVITGTAIVEAQGKEIGYWKSTSSHLNSEKRLHDNSYYQEYSYDIQTGLSFDSYKNVVLELLHIAGHKIFGKVAKETVVSLSTTCESVITQENV